MVASFGRAAGFDLQQIRSMMGNEKSQDKQSSNVCQQEPEETLIYSVLE
jgi:hypothetical protein